MTVHTPIAPSALDAEDLDAMPGAPRGARGPVTLHETSAEAIQSMRDIEAATGAVPVIGYCCWWNLGAVHIGKQEFARRYLASGLPAVPITAITLRRAARRTVQDWVHERAGRGMGADLSGSEDDDGDDEGTSKRVLLRPASRRGGKYLSYTLVLEELDKAAISLKHETEIRIHVHKVDETLHCDTEAKGNPDAVTEAFQVSAEMSAIWTRYRGVLLNRDASKVIKAAMDQIGAIRVKREGGVYFVPATAADKLFALQALVETLSGVSFLATLGVPDTKKARAEMVKSVHTGLMQEIIDSKYELEETLEESGKVRNKTLADRLRNFKRLQARVEAMGDLMDMQKGDLTREIAGLQAKVQALLDD